MQAYEPLQGVPNYFKNLKKDKNVYSKLKGIY